MEQTEVLGLPSGKNNRLFPSQSFEKKGIFSGIFEETSEKIEEERKTLIDEMEASLDLRESIYGSARFLGAFFHKSIEKEWILKDNISIYHQIIEWNLEVTERGLGKKYLIETYTPEYIKERIRFSLQEKARSIYAYNREERRNFFQLLRISQEQEKTKRESTLQDGKSFLERKKEAQTEYENYIKGELQNIEISERNQTGRRRRLQNILKELQTTGSIKILESDLINPSQTLLFELFTLRNEIKEIGILITHMPKELNGIEIDVLPQLTSFIDGEIIKEFRQNFLSEEKEGNLLKKGEETKNRVQDKIFLLQFLLSKLGYYDALERERRKGSISQIFTFMKNHTNRVVREAYQNYNDGRKRRNGDRMNGILDNETILALTYFQYQNLGKNTKDADGRIGPETMKIIIRDLNSRKI